MKKQKKKSILYLSLSTISFVLIALYNIRFQSDGLPILLLLVVHGCCILLFYRETLLSEDSIAEAEEFLSVSPPNDKKTAYTDDILTEVYRNSLYMETKELLTTAADALHKKSPLEDTAKIEQQETSEAVENTEKKPSAFAPALPPLTETDLILAAKEAIDSLSVFTAKQHIQMHLSADYEILPVLADPDSIRTLFRNIIDNSIKYMGRAGHLLITLSLLGDDIFIILKDTGNGLSPEETEHIFELNFQGSNRVSGNGLGLTQAKQIVESIGGTIYAKSNINNGMAIYIQLPVAKHK